MKKQRKVTALTISAFLLVSTFGNVLSVNAEENNLGTTKGITENAKQENNVQPLADGSASCTFENLTVTTNDGSALTYGTTADFDVYSSGKILYINTNKPVTVTGTTTTGSLAITKGTKADITLNNVSITNTTAAPIDIIANTVADPTTLHLTIADGSNNTLNAGTGTHAGIHVCYGGKLIIDDGVRNWADVEGGRIVGETDENGIQKPSWLMDSDNPGTLTVYGGYYSAGIGGQATTSSTAAGQSSGAIIINGGKIISSAPYGNNQNWSGGSGIGGSSYGGAGCLLDGGGIIINGGEIEANASYHGSGIGGGWHAGDVAGVGHSSTATGDITINGGYVKATGRDHGNAFGGACSQKDNIGHGTSGASHKITITGGTLLPQATSSGWYGVGAQKADVIVTGGSFYPTNSANASASGGAGITGASVVSADGTNLTMVKIAIGSMEDVEVGDRIYDFTVTVDGKPLSDTAGNFINYGLANKVAEDQTLYFWLPTSSIGKSVSISNVTLMKPDGTLIKAEYPFSLPSVGTGDTTKRWVTFNVDTDKFSDTLKGYLYKTYDGLGWDMDILAKEIVAQDIDIPEPKNEKIDQEDKLGFSSVRIKDWFGNATSDESTKGEISTTGTYTITVNYDEFKDDEVFNQSFWGHQTTLESIISPASSQITNLKAESTWQNDEHTKFATITLTANVFPGDGEAKTCAAPDGKVQFYINGVKVGNPVNVEEVTQPSEGSDEYAHSTARLFIDFTNEEELKKYPIPELSDGTFQVEAQYLGGTNYNLAEKRATIVEETSPEEFPFATPPTPKPGGEEDHPIVPDDYEVEDGEGDIKILHGYAKDSITNSVSSEPKIVSKDEFKEMFNERYDFINIKSDTHVDTELEEFIIKDKDENEVEEIDVSKAATYTIIATVYDKSNNYKTTLTVTYDLVRVNIDTDGDGKPDINIDKDGDGKPDINIDTDGDNEPDINIDTDDDGKPDINIVDKDGDGKPDTGIDPEDNPKPDVNIDKDDDGKPDINIDTDDDGKPDINIDKDDDGEPDINIDKDDDGKPDINIDTDDDGKPDINIDTDDDGKPDINIDTDDDGKPDINIDTDDDGKPDVNIDKDDDGKPDINIDKDGDGKPDINIDKDGDGKPDINIDTDDDGKPDINIDKDGDGDPDINVDTDDDGKPDINIDKDKDGDPDINIDKDGDGKPDINIVDKDGDGKPDDLDDKWPNIKDIDPDVNIDKDGDGKPDINVDTDDDGKPDVSIDKDGDGKPDINIDTDGDGKPDINIVDEDGDGKPDDLDDKWPNDLGDTKPNINIDKDGDGKPDLNIDTDGDGKADLNIDTDGDGKADLNIDITGDGKANLNIDTTGDGKANLNIDTDGDGKADLNIDIDGDRIADINLDKDGDGKIDIDIQGDDIQKVTALKKVRTSDDSSILEFASLAFASLFIAVIAFSYKRKED